MTKDLTSNNKISNAVVNIKKTEDVFASQEEIEVNEDLFPDSSSLIEDQVENESVGVGVDIEGNSPLQINLSYAGNKYDFTFIFEDKNPMSEWLKLEVEDKSANKYTITLNTRHLFFYPFIQKKDFLVLLAKFTTALVIAEINACSLATDGKVSPSSIRIEMGRILEDLK
ncbi:hypothetical protein NPL7_03365 [Metamycoplasma hyosynoviae]|uniref:hypothetical protein n=1 Tax=Metamycoplasma hyosynoviae TaxID=29559 RepID=UPI000461A040|nr:hypothetical protein [Metamycoplasma hyosynoviae]KDE41522.1 hypothetical protein NPL7_03365 [Metamycoplasma hyosynoviae]